MTESNVDCIQRLDLALSITEALNELDRGGQSDKTFRLSAVRTALRMIEVGLAMMEDRVGDLDQRQEACWEFVSMLHDEIGTDETELMEEDMRREARRFFGGSDHDT